MTFEDFQDLAADHNVIPLVRERLADYETPISLADKLRGQGKFFLLESVDGGEQWGRFSILGFDICRELVIRDDLAELIEDGQAQPLPGAPIAAVQTYLRQFRAVPQPELPRFFGGAVGYFSFESVRYFERCGTVKANDSNYPDAYFMIADHLAVFDNLSNTVKLVCCVHPGAHASLEAAWAHGQQTLDRLDSVLRQQGPGDPAAAAPTAVTELSSNMARKDYEAMVAKAKQYIIDGDIIQVVLAQHFSTETEATAFDIYRALRHINPSPYLYYLQLDGDRAIAGSSPEVMVRVTDRRAEVRPIAGTRPRGRDAAEDVALAADLLADPKELAEHVMLVDLARNDLGRVCDIGSVVVSDYMCIERYSHVMHIVSHVTGQVRPEFDAIDVFKATFPAGTLSGAPKVRAMEIINELEPIRRGPYGGALGYISYGARVMDMAITIRTVVVDNGRATVTAGAGIVYDSVPEREYQETVHKSDGMRRALELAARGCDLSPRTST